jgi:hypothetical protein
LFAAREQADKDEDEDDIAVGEGRKPGFVHGCGGGEVCLKNKKIGTDNIFFSSPRPILSPLSPVL